MMPVRAVHQVFQRFSGEFAEADVVGGDAGEGWFGGVAQKLIVVHPDQGQIARYPDVGHRRRLKHVDRPEIVYRHHRRRLREVGEPFRERGDIFKRSFLQIGGG